MPTGETRLRTDDGLLNQVGGRVKERRKALGLSQERLCARIADATNAGWIAHRHEVVAIEHGYRAVTTVELVALAQALEVDPCWLLLGEETEVPSFPTEPSVPARVTD